MTNGYFGSVSQPDFVPAERKYGRQKVAANAAKNVARKSAKSAVASVRGDANVNEISKREFRGKTDFYFGQRIGGSLAVCAVIC